MDRASGNRGYTRTARLSVDPQAALQQVTKRMQSSGTFWLLIGIYQLIVGVVTLFVGYGIFPIAVGIWNLINSSKQKKMAAEYAENPIGIVAAYESSKTMTIVFIFVNLFLGAGLGVLGSIYDLTTCNYVTSHKDAFSALEDNEKYAQACPACGANMDADAVFCPICGYDTRQLHKRAETVEPVKPEREMIACVNCGQTVEAGMAFCPYCGSSPTRRREAPRSETASTPEARTAEEASTPSRLKTKGFSAPTDFD